MEPYKFPSPLLRRAHWFSTVTELGRLRVFSRRWQEGCFLFFSFGATRDTRGILVQPPSILHQSPAWHSAVEFGKLTLIVQRSSTFHRNKFPSRQVTFPFRFIRFRRCTNYNYSNPNSSILSTSFPRSKNPSTVGEYSKYVRSSRQSRRNYETVNLWNVNIA